VGDGFKFRPLFLCDAGVGVMSKYSIAQLGEVIESFAQRGAFERAVPSLKLLQRYLQTPDDYLQALRLLDRFPTDNALALSEFREILADILRGTKQLQRLKALARNTLEQVGETAAAPVFLEYAGLLQNLRQHAAAHEVLTGIRPVLHGEPLGRCLVYMAWSSFELGQPWEAALNQGFPLLSGLEKA
jgi:hypothetical protein